MPDTDPERSQIQRPTPHHAQPDPSLVSPAARPGAARVHGGRGDISNRTDQSQHAATKGVEGGAYGQVTTWSSESGEVISCEQDITEVPLMITIRPAIKGYGLPSAVKLQHGLPKQKPYCEKGLECIKAINELLEDGQSMWYLEATPVEHNDNVAKSARFRSMFRKIGRGTKFWHMSLSPIEDIIKWHTQRACAEHEFAIDLPLVKASVQIMRDAQGWSCLTDRLIDTAILNVVKHNMMTMRGEGKSDRCLCSSSIALYRSALTRHIDVQVHVHVCLCSAVIGECCVKVLQYLHGVVKSTSCPGFLLPNVNIATRITSAERAWVAQDLQQVLAQMQKHPGYVMSFVGFHRQSDDTDNSLR